MQNHTRQILCGPHGRGRAARFLIFGFVAAASLPLNAQFFRIIHTRPTVPVTITHPATLGLTLTGKKVAFGQVSGACPQQFVDAIMQTFIKEGVTLENRSELDAILAEHRLQVSGSVDQATAVQLGKILGPSVMIFVNASRCLVEKKALYEDNYGVPRTNISRTEAHFLASIHTVDLATGRELAVRSVAADPRDERRSDTGIPEYPSETELQDMAVRDAAIEVDHLFFPWAETHEVSFMNAKECNLKQAYELLRAGDAQGALKLSRENVDLCKSDPKAQHQADAWYNLGVAHMLVQDYDNALAALAESQKLHPDKTTLDTSAECRQAKSLAAVAAERQRQVANAVLAEREGQQKREDQVARSMLNNEYIVRLVKGGLSEEIIVKMIASQPARFSVVPDDLLALKQAGVPDRVIAAMLDKK